MERSSPQAPNQHWAGSLTWRLVLLVLVMLTVNYWAATRVTQSPTRVRVPYSPFFLRQVESNNVLSITSKGTAIQGVFTRSVRYPPGKKTEPTTLFATEVPSFADTQALSALLQRHGVVINAKPPSTSTPWWQNLIYGLLPTLMIVGLLVWLARRAATTQGGLMAFGRSRARRVEGTATGVTFADVAGIDEAKAELTEIVDFLRNPAKYRRLGGRIPRGVLLSGPPGTGKTLLARAVAGEAGVPFFSMSGSEFVEMLVGVGASRVRDLFAQAKAAEPAIVFIDELDAIGRSRGPGVTGFSGGHEEREQTLDQILTEMDGFDVTTGVIVLAATNRPDVLDQALLRPGRFDRRVAVQPPDLTGRRLILEVHTRSIPIGDDVDLGALAATTPGMVGADLANLVNEATLLAARLGHDSVVMSDFTETLEKLILGAERKIVLSPEDRRRTAYHEAGHALVGMLTPGADPVRKISIIPRGTALGVTFSAPTTDRFSYREEELRAKVEVALGGRAAEELVYGELSTGAENDIRQVTELARQMVGRFGMSETIGPLAILPTEERASPLFPDLPETSERTRRRFDDEVQRIVTEAYGIVSHLLEANREKLDSLADALLEHETLDTDDAYAAAELLDRRPVAALQRTSP